MPFKELPKQPDLPKLEEGVLKFWEKERIFDKTLQLTKNRPVFVVFEGPPTANGKPHIGHVITRVFKDIVPRYKTMQGFHVLRKGGWDTHGLGVEVEVEKEIGVSGKQDIENLVPGDPKKSIAKFNELCKRSVWKYVDLWEKMIRRVGNWFDLEDAYATYDKDFIESIWWAFKEYWKKGLLYRGFKVVPYCTRCGTPLSSHEVAQGYEEVEDTSVYVRFPLVGERETSLLAWTTTPWTLPGNVALAVDKDADYVKVKEGERGGEERFVIVAQDRAGTLGLKEIVKRMKGSDLVGKHYQPLYPWLRSLVPDRPKFLVVEGDFVSMEEGTGIVHTAVMYGEEDFALGLRLGLPQRHLVDRNGRFVPEAGWLSGRYVKDADPLIVHDLNARALIHKEERIRHQYPFCWRCHRPLLYYALESWFVKTTAVQDLLKKHNREVNWVPEHVGSGRMANWYESLIDWSMSRNRYWGTPLPAWVCDRNADHVEVIGSYAELAKKARKRLGKDFDPHRPFIDELTWGCVQRDGGRMHRTPEVTDVWHDSGCMPFAQWHYPFENTEMVAKGKQFPADYISEAIDQTRGWFFSLQAVSTILFGKSPYKNVVVFEHALDERGRKMSKHLGNVVDPWELFQEVGADPVRWFFLTSVTIGTQYRVSVEQFRDVVRRFFLILWNSAVFFTTYANVDHWEPTEQLKTKKLRNSSSVLQSSVKSQHILDRWIIAKTNELVEEVTNELDAYDFPAAGRAVQDFVVNDLSTWYIRRSRDRVGRGSAQAAGAHATLYEVLKTLSTLLAPFIPFTAEMIYRTLRNSDDPVSVHLVSWPKPRRIDHRLLADMAEARKVVEEGLRLRKEKGIKVRQPLAKVTVTGVRRWPAELSQTVADELNVKKLELGKAGKFSLALDTTITKELAEEGSVRELIRAIQDLRKKAGYKYDQRVKRELETGDKNKSEILGLYQYHIDQATNTTVAAITSPQIEGESQGIKISLKA